MKKIYILLLALTISTLSFGQDMVITGAFDGPLSGGTPKAIEIYVINDIADLSTFGIGSANNGGGTDNQEFTFTGNASAGDYIYITDGLVNFEAYFGFAADYADSTANNNGDDALELFSNNVVIDTFGNISVDGTGEAWEYLDGWAYRNNSTGPDSAVFTVENWVFSGANAVDGCTSNATCSSEFPIGTFTYGGNPCGVSFGTITYNCDSSTIGDDNDFLAVEIPYAGSNGTITSVTTTSGGTVGGDDPASVANGTIIIIGLSEGDAWDITLNGGDCNTTTTSGTVLANECDPTPTTCYDLSAGSDSFELVDVVLNSSGDGWSNTSGTYNLNPYCGSGCAGDVEAWLVFGPLDTTQTADLNLALTTTKQYGDTQLGVAYTTSYSGCPSSTTWTTATTIAASGNIDVDLSAANGANVFIGISYIDDGTYSNWTLSNIALESFDTCPPLGTVPTSNCAVCDLSLQTESYVCLTNTDGNGNDGATVEIAYTGVEDTITSITTASGGSIAGDDPATVTDGTITITGLSEGAVWDLTINGGDCDGTTVSGTIPLSVCDPVTTNLVINEILADPGSTDGDANGDSVISTTNDEFVEIYNTGTSALDISGYTLRDITSVRHTFPNPTILQPGTFLTVFGGGSIDSFTGNAQLASGGSLGLNNGGDTVTIKNAVGVVVTTVAYTGASDQSLCREPDFTGDFVGHLSHTAHAVTFSPGAMNDGTFSVNSLNNASFNLYPNPTKSGFVNITSTGSETVQATIFDILGKQVLNASVANGRLNVSTLNTGVYIVKLTQGEATTTKKLIIQ